MCEAKHACLHTDKDAGSLRLWASLPRACGTRAVQAGESRQTRKGRLLQDSGSVPASGGGAPVSYRVLQTAYRGPTSPPEAQKRCF